MWTSVNRGESKMLCELKIVPSIHTMMNKKPSGSDSWRWRKIKMQTGGGIWCSWLLSHILSGSSRTTGPPFEVIWTFLNESTKIMKTSFVSCVVRLWHSPNTWLPWILCALPSTKAIESAREALKCRLAIFLWYLRSSMVIRPQLCGICLYYRDSWAL